jgi:hypothetical protein
MTTTLDDERLVQAIAAALADNQSEDVQDYHLDDARTALRVVRDYDRQRPR